MDLLVDLFGYLSIIVHGLTILSQSMALGGVLFLVLLACPLAPRLRGAEIAAGTARIAGYAALALLLSEAATVALQTAVLVDTVDLSVMDVLHAEFALAGMVKTIAAAALAILLLGLKARAPALPLLALTVIELAAATLTTHAAARLGSRGWLLAVEGLHQLGAAIWVGGIPCFLLALSRVRDGAAFRLVGTRFSRMSMAGVACILVSGITMTVLYIGSWDGFYGTAFGVMVGRLSRRFDLTSNSKCSPITPVQHATPVWALPISLATTQGIIIIFFSSGYLDVSVLRVGSLSSDIPSV